MQPSEISLIRLDTQHMGGTEFSTPQAIVSWMCAMQAQDFPMAEWAIGVRLPGSTFNLIEQAMDRGDILRTHLLRPTWHFVTSEDICWLLDLTAPQIKASQRSRDRQLELTEEIYSQSNSAIEQSLKLHGQLSREELMVELNNVGIATDQNRASHLFMRAELEKIICSGAILRGKPTYALLSERVPKSRLFVKEEALAELAKRYFASRGPATLPDFAWWSGLPAREARQALEMVKSSLLHEEMDGVTYWFSQDLKISLPDQSTAYLLPTYDEFIISYSDRSASIPGDLEHHMREISNRGVFWPVIVINGQVIGIWKRTSKKDHLWVEIHPFLPLQASILALIEQAASQFASFWEKRLEFTPSSIF